MSVEEPELARVKYQQQRLTEAEAHAVEEREKELRELRRLMQQPCCGR